MTSCWARSWPRGPSGGVARHRAGADDRTQRRAGSARTRRARTRRPAPGRVLGVGGAADAADEAVPAGLAALVGSAGQARVSGRPGVALPTSGNRRGIPAVVLRLFGANSIFT